MPASGVLNAAATQHVPWRRRAAVRHKAAEGVRQHRSDVHRWTFAPDRTAAQKRRHGEQRTPEGHVRPQKRLTLRPRVGLQRENSLRDAAALGAAEKASRQPGDECEAGRREQPRPPQRVPQQAAQQRVRPVREPRKGDRGTPDRNASGPQHQPRAPVLPGEQRPACPAHRLAHGRQIHAVGSAVICAT
jgi:hypothetical protein